MRMETITHTQTKVCIKCKVEKSSDGFHVLKSRTNNVCRECKNESLRKWQRDNKEKTKATRDRWRSKQTPERLKEIRDGIIKRSKDRGKRYYLKYKYGISEIEYQSLLLAQAGSCKICSAQANGKYLYVDHCHKSGVVRGLLCQTCNTGLGMFKDQSELLERALAYLEGAKE